MAASKRPSGDDDLEDTVPDDLYVSPEVMKLTGVTYRQLDHWASQGVIRGQSGMGSGHRRVFRRMDVMVTAILCKLRHCGMEFREVVTLADYLYDHPDRLDREFLVLAGDHPHSIEDYETLIQWLGDHPQDFVAILRLNPIRERLPK